jgi:hypothetical protein
MHQVNKFPSSYVTHTLNHESRKITKLDYDVVKYFHSLHPFYQRFILIFSRNCLGLASDLFPSSYRNGIFK